MAGDNNENLTNELIILLLQKHDDAEILLVENSSKIKKLEEDVERAIKSIEGKSDKNKLIVILKSKESMVAITTAAVIGLAKVSWDHIVTVFTKLIS